MKGSNMNPYIIKAECVYCGNEATEKDHIVPIISGGNNHPNNLQDICRYCNLEKSGNSEEAWREITISKGLEWPRPSFMAVFSRVIRPWFTEELAPVVNDYYNDSFSNEPDYIFHENLMAQYKLYRKGAISIEEAANSFKELFFKRLREINKGELT